jgi:mitofilin
VATQNEAYRELFTQLPGGEELADFADAHDWDQFGVGTLTQAALKISELTGGNKEEIQAKIENARKVAEAKAADFTAAAKVQATEAQKRAQAAKEAAIAKAHEIQHKIEDKTAEVKDKAAELGSQAATKVESTANKAADKASDAVASTIQTTQHAVEAVQEKVAEVQHVASTPVNRFPDTQRPRELRPETVQREKPSFAGKEEYKEQLPIGFEPPPGYYLLPPPAKKALADGEPLPLLVPKVKALAGSEPVVAQLATTIDSLTTSLQNGKAGSNAKAAEILDRAQGDLAALTKRIADVKKTEEARLQKAVETTANKFHEELAVKQAEWQKGEANLKDSWEAERQKMVESWREVLDSELSTQREVIEKR